MWVFEAALLLVYARSNSSSQIWYAMPLPRWSFQQQQIQNFFKKSRRLTEDLQFSNEIFKHGVSTLVNYCFFWPNHSVWKSLKKVSLSNITKMRLFFRNFQTVCRFEKKSQTFFFFLFKLWHRLIFSQDSTQLENILMKCVCLFSTHAKIMLCIFNLCRLVDFPCTGRVPYFPPPAETKLDSCLMSPFRIFGAKCALIITTKRPN